MTFAEIIQQADSLRSPFPLFQSAGPTVMMGDTGQTPGTLTFTWASSSKGPSCPSEWEAEVRRARRGLEVWLSSHPRIALPPIGCRGTRSHITICHLSLPVAPLALRTKSQAPGCPAGISGFLPSGLPPSPPRLKTHPRLSHLLTCTPL